MRTTSNRQAVRHTRSHPGRMRGIDRIEAVTGDLIGRGGFRNRVKGKNPIAHMRRAGSRRFKCTHGCSRQLTCIMCRSIDPCPYSLKKVVDPRELRGQVSAGGMRKDISDFVRLAIHLGYGNLRRRRRSVCFESPCRVTSSHPCLYV